MREAFMDSTKPGVSLCQLNPTKRNSPGRVVGLVISILAGPALLAVLLFAMARPTRAADYVVTNTNDSGSTVMHTYTSAGVYHVSVTAANGGGNLSAVTTATVVGATSAKIYLPLVRR